MIAWQYEELRNAEDLISNDAPGIAHSFRFAESTLFFSQPETATLRFSEVMSEFLMVIPSHLKAHRPPHDFERAYLIVLRAGSNPDVPRKLIFLFVLGLLSPKHKSVPMRLASEFSSLIVTQTVILVKQKIEFCCRRLLSNIIFVSTVIPKIRKYAIEIVFRSKSSLEFHNSLIPVFLVLDFKSLQYPTSSCKPQIPSIISRYRGVENAWKMNGHATE